MVEDELVLRLGLEDGRNANAEAAAQSLIAWVALLKEASRAIDPADELTVELLGTAPGSLQFPQVLRFVERAAKDISEGASDYPYLKKTAIGLALATSTAVLQTGIETALKPTVQVVSLDVKDHKLLADMRDKVASSAAVQSAARRFYRTVEQDPAVDEVTVAETTSSEPLIVVPRSEFPERSGLWTPEELPAPERTSHAVWDVVLLRAPFVPVPRSWGFMREGLPFSARMEDPAFLAAVGAGTIPITLQEGVEMQIEVEFKERREGQVWAYVEGTRRVLKVRSPLPVAKPLPLASAPKKQ